MDSPCNQLLVQCLFFAVLLMPLNGFAYEQTTHAALTREAILQSTVSPATPDVLQRLGISDRQIALGDAYLDLADDGVIRSRSNAPSGRQYPLEFGKSKIVDANRQASFRPGLDSVAGWLMLGAVREDDVKYDDGALENNPQDDPSPANRVLNHFYDPFNDQQLNVPGLLVSYSALSWALLSHTGNDFSSPKAHEAMWRALTLKSAPNEGLLDLPFSASADIPTKEALRVAYWATTFRALGDVLHLVQDMAQPQHTRNDRHSGMFCTSDHCYGGHASFYEKYVDTSVKGDKAFTLRERTVGESFSGGHGDIPDLPVPTSIGPVTYSGYPIPRFADYRSYFVTATGPASITGKGLANYSNQGFYSAGTNVGPGAMAQGYPSPSANGQGLTDVVIPDGALKDTGDQTIDGTLVLKLGTVVDALNPAQTATAVRLTSVGMFDQFLNPLNKSQYTLNHYNYDDQMRLLIPRAVAYSAGLLDFFFRGRMEIGPPDEGVYGIVDHAQVVSQGVADPLGGFNGFQQIRLRLSNSTPAIITTADGTKVPQPMSKGMLVAVLKFHRNACYSDRLDGEITDSQQLALCRTTEEEIVVSDPVKVPDQGPVPLSDANPSGAEFTFKFGKALPINAWDVVLQVVYRGQLGGESDAVVVATRDISEPTFITTFNDTDKILIAGTCYDAATVAATDALWNQLASGCKPTSGGPREVSTNCVNIPLNIRLTTGAAGSQVTAATDNSSGDHRLAPRRFSRIAVLGDIAGGTTMTLGFNNSLALAGPTTLHYLNYHAEQQTLVTFSGNAYSSMLSAVADTYVKHRGVKVWQGQYFAIDGTTATVSNACPDPQLDPLTGSERYPQQATVTGWDDQ
jgi:hypothetical protein